MARYTAAIWTPNGTGGHDRIGLNVQITVSLKDCELVVKQHLLVDEIPDPVEIVRWNDDFTESEIARKATSWPFPPE